MQAIGVQTGSSVKPREYYSTLKIHMWSQSYFLGTVIWWPVQQIAAEQEQSLGTGTSSQLLKGSSTVGRRRRR